MYKDIIQVDIVVYDITLHITVYQTIYEFFAGSWLDHRNKMTTIL